MIINDVKQLKIPARPGSYQFFNAKKEIVYIGKAVNLHSRVLSYWRKSAAHTPAKKKMMKEIEAVEWIETDTEIEALLLEANLIKKYQPYYNVDLRDDKRFSYIKISTEDDIPGVFVTRQIDKQGKYFGPFTSAGAVRETLKVIRKIWPYCTERKLKKKVCFYAQIGRCLGVCGGEFDVQEYKNKIIKPIILFLSGKKGKIITNYKLQITNCEKKLNQKNLNDNIREEIMENMQFLKKKVLNINHVLECANVIGLGEKYAADVVELAKILNLPKIPSKIEGYDISNIFGKEAVGSMVVFDGGEPSKKEYRKFKIKLSEGLANDTYMLREILERRFSNEWPLPDLIIIDGGKGQLNVGIRILKKYKLESIPIIAISKGMGLRGAGAPDKIFFPGKNKALELPLASPALHIIKRVRDEAHRFAIKYHRELRKKTWLKR